VAGKEVVGSRQFIFVPEACSRQERNQGNMNHVIQLFSYLIVFFVFLIGIIYASANWIKKKFPKNVFVYSLGTLTLFGVINLLNGYPAKLAQLTNQEPKSHQLFTWIGFSLLKLLVLSGGAGILIANLHLNSRQRAALSRAQAYLLGYGIGILGVLIPNLVNFLFPAHSPNWGKLTGLNLAYPPLMGFSLVEKYIALSLLFSTFYLLVEKWTYRWSRRKALEVGLYCLLGFALAGFDIETPLQWTALGLALSLFFWISTRIWIRSAINLIPLISATPFVVNEWRQISLHPYTGCTLHSCIAMTLVCLSSLFWYLKLESQARLK
jgi:hypothetical protein